MPKPGIKIYTKRIPPDVRKIIIDAQAEIRNECLCQFSQEKTIYKLIRLAAKSQKIET